MAMRDLITGGAACAVPGAPSSSSNPLGALADSILGTSSKQERLKELPALPGLGPSASSELGFDRPLTSLPGSEYDQEPFQRPYHQDAEFLQRFNSAERAGYEDAWQESTGIKRENQDYLPEFERIYDQGVNNFHSQPTFDGTPQRVLSGFLRSFVDSSRSEYPFRPAQLPTLGLSEGDKRCIRDRSTIMARHFFADKSEDYINAQINSLLHSLDIENDLRGWPPQAGRFSELEEYWNESQVTGYNSMHKTFGSKFDASHPADNWVAEYSQRNMSENAGSWAEEFQQNRGVDAWADQFNQEQSQMDSIAPLRNGNFSNSAALEQTRMLAHTLSQNADPKFQNSKFLQFVSKMSRGELIVDDNQVKPAVTSQANAWADEYQLQHDGKSWGAPSLSNDWANEYQHSHHGETWVDEYVQGKEARQEPDEAWVNEFSKMHVQDWAEDFSDQVSKGVFEESSADGWADTYEKYLEEQLKGEQQLPGSSRFVYSFSDQNPYVGHPNPLKEGQELFRKGLLSEAVLALEAEVLKNPDNSEGWRLLGITHAENDDDQQAIASMVRARDADPTNLEVLLALGVSHTNELEQAVALSYLRGWLEHHPKYGVLIPQDQAENLSYIEVARLFNEAAQMSPEDGDVHTVLGVLYNLSREYDKAIGAFQNALKLKPRDYSLWNKLGATQANSAQSADAIYAYQQALDLKPNYVRAWANMGISFANQGRYEESIRYYVRALTMNPKAENAWQYLRISLSCAGKTDSLEACEVRDLDALQKEFPL
ncbi:peroxisome biogenesis protein 5 [Cryptomeria japonica]|uniref:peroxisome biogenesis protein 5 n=1 Tax=Cryptomeria japonica TaxID=3369 RepID=UPI0025ABDED3|nr:peroxisome biogenesis protein 5 [Cryptomeria japonica]